MPSAFPALPRPVRTAVARRRGALRIAATLIAAAALAALPALPAVAHDDLASSSPSAGATVTTAPRAVSIGFDEPVLDYSDSTVLIVTGPDASTRHSETACPRVEGRTVSAAVALGASGRYTVTWRVVSADGHPVSDTFTFTFHRAPGTAPATGSASGPACGGGAATAAGGSGTAGSSTAVSPVVWVLLGVGGALVLVLLAVVIAVAVRLRRRPARAAADAEAGSG